MLLVLALRASPERVYGRARRQFSVAEITVRRMALIASLVIAAVPLTVIVVTMLAPI